MFIEQTTNVMWLAWLFNRTVASYIIKTMLKLQTFAYLNTGRSYEEHQGKSSECGIVFIGGESWDMG